MRLVRLLLGGAPGIGLVAALALVAACAKGSEADTSGGGDDAGADDGRIDDAGTRRDVRPPLPPDDSAAPDGAGCSRRVVINEIMTATTASPTEELVEIYNAGTCAQPLGDWKLSYRAKNDNPGATLYTFAAGDSIAAGQRLLFASYALAGKNGDLTSGTGMHATDGQVGLLDDTDKLVDGVAYGAVAAGTFLEKRAAPSPPASSSIARKSDGQDTDDNAADFEVSTPPTPGAPN